MWWDIQQLVYYEFNAECAGERFLKSMNIWRNYRQEGLLSHTPCAPGHCPA